MSILSDLFVADPAGALRYETEAAFRRELPSWVRGRARFTGLIDLQYAVLWAALERRTWQPETHSLEMLSMRKDGGPWLFRFPLPFVARLADIDAGGVDPVADQWIESGELHGATTAEVLPILRELTQLARMARADGKGLFLWGSL